MLYKIFKKIIFTCAVVVMVWVCIPSAGYAEQRGKDAGGLLSIEPNGDTYCLTLSEWPNGAVSAAILFDLSPGEGNIVPKIDLDSGTRGMSLTLGKPTDGRVRVLIDGTIPHKADDASAPIRLINLRIPALPDYVPAVSNAVLWVRFSDGRTEAYLLSVQPVESDTAAPSDDSAPSLSESIFEGSEEPPADTLAEIESFEPTTNPESAQIPLDSSPETGEFNPPANHAASVYLGCRETSAREGIFAVKLLFFVPFDAPVPLVVCMGGGQSITLFVERTAGSSVLIFTYRGLCADRQVRFHVYTPDGVVEILYENGRFQSHNRLTS